MKKTATALLFLAVTMLSGCGKFFYYPDSKLYFPPKQLGFTHQEITFTSKDGSPLHGWFFRARKKTFRGTVVQFHGNAQNVSSHYASVVWLIDEGFDVFTFDYRGYGKSPGKPDAEGLYQDGLAALEQAWKLRRPNSKNSKEAFVVIGQSMGGLVAASTVADWEKRKDVSLLLLDSTFSSFKDMVQEKMAGIWLTWVFSPIGRLTVSDEFASKSRLEKLDIPVLVVHDRKDPVVDLWNGEEIDRRLLHAKPKALWVIDERSHVGFFAKPERRAQFLDFLRRIDTSRE